MSARIRNRTSLLAVLAALIIGCVTSQNDITYQAPSSSDVLGANNDDSENALSVAPDVSPEETQPAVKTALFGDIEIAKDPSDSSPSVQVAALIEDESIAIGESELTLETIEHLALSNSPAIQQAKAASARAGGIRTQVGLKPNPTVGYFGEEIGNEGSGGLHGGFISQTFVRGDKLSLNRRVIDQDVNAMNWQIETQRQRILTDVRVAFYGALAAQKRLQLAREFRSVAEKGVTISKAQVEAKIGARPDILQSEIQLNEVDLAIQRAEYELTAARMELAALAGVSEFAQRSLSGQLDSNTQTRDEKTEYAQIIAGSPQLAAAQARVVRARANLQRQKVQPIPNVTAQLGAGGDATTGSAFANVQLRIPIPIHNNNEGNIRAAYAEYCAASQNVERIRAFIRRELARVMREYSIAKATVSQYESSVLPKAEETMKLMLEAQEAGEFDFLRVLTARRAYFDANLHYVAAKGDLAQANAKIDGMLLANGLSTSVNYEVGDDLRGQTLNNQ